MLSFYLFILIKYFYESNNNNYYFTSNFSQATVNNLKHILTNKYIVTFYKKHWCACDIENPALPTYFHNYAHEMAASVLTSTHGTEIIFTVRRLIQRESQSAWKKQMSFHFTGDIAWYSSCWVSVVWGHFSCVYI